MENMIQQCKRNHWGNPMDNTILGQRRNGKSEYVLKQHITKNIHGAVEFHMALREVASCPKVVDLLQKYCCK
jgi:hypothetical protein